MKELYLVEAISPTTGKLKINTRPFFPGLLLLVLNNAHMVYYICAMATGRRDGGEKRRGKEIPHLGCLISKL